jgi:predicted AlkP superfamily pyrophosphatase or phosphodiesterase
MIIKKINFLVLLIIIFTAAFYPQSNNKPKLVVGIVIDQMRFDYLYRFSSSYGKDGFNRLSKDGSSFTFAHYNYELTSTAPGHAAIYTGTTPFYNGIIGNDFYDRTKKKMVYCIADDNYKSVGCDNDEGQKSPVRILSTTITDELKLATNGKSKVISVSLKDRGAVIPGGHNPDGVYWYDSKTGNFISSTYYINTLPGWVVDFNNKKFVDSYLSSGWQLSLPVEKYNLNPSDESKYEKDKFNEGKTAFPHLFGNLSSEEKYVEFENTPFANQIVAEFAKSALVNENLGQGNETDFLAISFSATDHVGHEYGTVSYELQDTYIKLDEQLAELFKLLDEKVGKENYLLFLTADHAAIPTPAYLKDNRMPTGELNHKKSLDSLKAFSIRNFGDDNIIENYSNRQIFLNREILKKKKLDIHIVQHAFADYIRETFPSVTSVFTRDFLETQMSSREQNNFAVNGFHPSLSGDVVFDLRPGYLINFLDKGTTHGSAYSYDTHVPIIFYGWKIPAQTINTPVYITDIAATIANLLKITEPSASIGIPLISEDLINK